MLPKITTLKFNLYIEELKKEIKYRAMKVGEKKQIITATQLGDNKALTNLIYDLIDACTFNALDLNKLPSYVVDFIYMNIWARSQSELAPVTYKCNVMSEKFKDVEVDGEVKRQSFTEPCGTKLKINIPILKMQIMYPEGFSATKTVMINDKVGMKLKVPNLEQQRLYNMESEDILEVADEFIMSCIDMVFNENEVLVPNVDFTFEEFRNWMDDMESSALSEIDEFIKKIPKVGLDYNVICPTCKTKHTLRFRGLDDFFGLRSAQPTL